MNRLLRTIGGCGLAVVIIIALVMGLILSNSTDDSSVPDATPPVGGKEVANIDVNAPGRTADKLTHWASDLAEATDIPPQALRAYGNAELIARQQHPGCNLRWNTLAGLGFVETRHGTYNGNWFKSSKLDDNGYPQPPIVGITLDGSNNTAHTPDTDNGEIDGDTEFDRAVGPLQFIPTSWESAGGDANGDGKADPNQIDDAALGAANLLCFGDRDLNDPDQWEEAILNYNQSREYLDKVAHAANAYSVPQPAR